MYKKVFIIFAVLLIIIAALPGCSHSTGKLAPGEPPYASGITQTMLEAINAVDYENYSRSFSSEMAQRTPESIFSDYCTFIQSKIGAYKSKKFSSAKTDGDETTIIYTAKFTKEPKDVTVTVIFLATSGNVTVDDFWLNSPKMWENATPKPQS